MKLKSATIIIIFRSFRFLRYRGRGQVLLRTSQAGITAGACPRFHKLEENRKNANFDFSRAAPLCVIHLARAEERFRCLCDSVDVNS